MKNLILLRHGECGEPGKYAGRRTDIPLTDEGKQQIRRMGVYLKQKGIIPGTIITSRLIRARESGQILKDELKLPDSALSSDARLDELDFGSFEGLTYEEICRLYPAESRTWFEDPWKNAPPGGETSAELAERVEDYYNRLKKTFSETENDLLIAAHGGSLRLLICFLLESPPEQHWHFRLERGGMARFQISGDFPILAEITGSLSGQ